jgi:hypothetical protein
VAAALRTTMVPVREAVAPEIGALFAACSAWPVGPAPVLETAPVHSEIPTLVLAGEFDPITPPAYAAMIDRDLPAATAVTVRGYGHGTVGLGPCPVAIAVRFLGDPTTRPDTRCAAAAPFRFEIPRRRGGLPTVGGGGEAAAALRRWRGSIMP